MYVRLNQINGKFRYRTGFTAHLVLHNTPRHTCPLKHLNLDFTGKHSAISLHKVYLYTNIHCL